jgi:hypothetical protein
MLISLVLYGGFALAHLSWLKGDESRFVIAGAGLSDPREVPDGLYVIDGSYGYDGQFFYRLALEPLTDRKTDHGITLDSPSYRQQRIGYPALAWALSGGGRARSIPWALIGINIAAMAAVGLAGAALARSLERNALWGLVFPLYPGFVVSTARDLAEPLAAALLLSGLVSLRRGRSTWAALALTAAVLTRETTAVVPIGLAVVWLTGRVRRSTVRPAREFLAPFVVFGAWQLFLYGRWNRVAMFANENAVDPPFVGMANQVRRSVSNLTSSAGLSLLEIGLAVALFVAAVFVIRSNKLLPYERWAFAAAAFGVALFDKDIWYDHAHFLRALTEFYLMGTLIVLAGMRKAPYRFALIVTGMWLTLVSIFVRNL